MIGEFIRQTAAKKQPSREHNVSMKKIYWQIIVGITSCVVLYQLAVRCNFSQIKKLSPATMETVLLLLFVYILVDISYLNSLLKASAAFTGFKNTLLLYCSSHIIATFSTYYVGLASFIIMVKKTVRTTYKHALSCSLADLLIRYSLRIAFATLGIGYLFGCRYLLMLPGTALLILMLCMLFKKKLMALLLRRPWTSSVVQYFKDMKGSLAGFSMNKLTALFLLAIVHLFTESLIFFIILKQFGYEYNLLLVLGIRSLGLFIGYFSFFPAHSVVEDLGVIGLWVLLGTDQGAAFLAVIINRIIITIIPAILSLIIVNCFFHNFSYSIRTKIDN
jgi:uncharacterized membrane protein YbhN (UPF0104 family)